MLHIKTLHPGKTSDKSYWSTRYKYACWIILAHNRSQTLKFLKLPKTTHLAHQIELHALRKQSWCWWWWWWWCLWETGWRDAIALIRHAVLASSNREGLRYSFHLHSHTTKKSNNMMHGKLLTVSRNLWLGSHIKSPIQPQSEFKVSLLNLKRQLHKIHGSKYYLNIFMA